MKEPERKTIEIPEICRVEGHSAVTVDIVDGKVENVLLDVFEGTRFFERIVLGHHYSEIPHITSRVCAICSTGHILAASYAVERVLKYQAPERTELFRELMHLGMIIESHATHVCALALPDFLGAQDVLEFATAHPSEFEVWTRLRNLGASIQTTVGGRPFHPVNLQVGGLSSYPGARQLRPLRQLLEEGAEPAIRLCRLLAGFRLPVRRTTDPCFLALVPRGDRYGFFGDTIRSSDGWEESIDNYREYLSERSVPYSHAKQSLARGRPLMVGAMARQFLFGDRLGEKARALYELSPLSSGDTNTIGNNLAQAIEIVEAIDRALEILDSLAGSADSGFSTTLPDLKSSAGRAVGAVECPRGTLYHFYELDEAGRILSADMITPSAQNTARIELDVREVVEKATINDPQLQAHLETLIRAYDPCNTCATHMVSVRYREPGANTH